MAVSKEVAATVDPQPQVELKGELCCEDEKMEEDKHTLEPRARVPSGVPCTTAFRRMLGDLRPGAQDAISACLNLAQLGLCQVKFSSKDKSVFPSLADLTSRTRSRNWQQVTHLNAAAHFNQPWLLSHFGCLRRLMALRLACLALSLGP